MADVNIKVTATDLSTAVLKSAAQQEKNMELVTKALSDATKDLGYESTKATKQVADLGESAKKTSDNTKKAAEGMSHAAESADEIDTLGSKATSSLGALSSGFELLGDSGAGAAKGLMTAALATDFMSGAGEAAFIATNQLKSVVEKAKVAWEGFSTAAKTAALTAGAIGVVLLAVGIAYAVMAKRAQEAAQRQAAVREGGQQLVDTLDKETGALTKATRAQILKDLQQNYSIQNAERLGLTARDLVDALMGEAAATSKVADAVNAKNRIDEFNNATSDEARKKADERIASAEYLRKELGLETDKLSEANTIWEQNKEVIDGSTAATIKNIDALKKYNQAIEDQFNPMSNLVHRMQDLKTAQKNYTDAVKEHGPKSEEARQANLALAEAAVAANTAAGEAAGTFDGHLTPALRKVLENAGLSAKQIKEIERAFQGADAAGKALSKRTYTGRFNIYTTFYDKYISEGAAGPGAGERGGHAYGGATSSAATGGSRGGEVLINEMGGELIHTPDGSVVIPHGQSTQMLYNMMGNGGMGGRTQLEIILPRATGLAFLDALIEGLRFKIDREGGGNVQDYLGSGNSNGIS